MNSDTSDTPDIDTPPEGEVDDERDHNGKTRLMRAAELGDSELVMEYLRQGDDVTLQDHHLCNVLHYAARSNERDPTAVIHAILEMRPKDTVTLVVNQRNNDNEIPLHIAAQNEQYCSQLIVEFLEIDGIDVNFYSNNGQIFLRKLLDIISDGQIDVNKQYNNGKTLLHLAVYQGYFNAVEQICNIENVQNIKDNRGVTPIDMAVEYKLYPQLCKLVQTLPGDQIEVNKRYENGNTLLHLAVEKRDLDAVKRISTLPGVRCNKNDENDNPFELVSKLEVPLYFLIHLYKVPGSGIELNDNINLLYRGKGLIHIATQLGDKKECKRLLETFSNIDVNVKDGEGRTALHIATTNRDIDTIHVLYENERIDVNARDGQGMSALHVAAANNDLKTVKALCSSSSIDLNAKRESNDQVETPLQRAIEDNATSVAIFLLSMPTIDMNVKDNNGNNIFIDVNKRYKAKEGNTLLHLAVQQANLDALKRICNLRAVQCQKNDRGFYPSDLVDSEQISDPLSFLIHLYKLPGSGIKFNDEVNKLYKGKGLMHYVAELNDKEECKRLLETFPNIDINTKDGQGMTALQIAIEKNSKSVALFLLSDPTIDVNIKDKTITNIFEIFCNIIEMRSEEGYIKPSERLIEALTDLFPKNLAPNLALEDLAPEAITEEVATKESLPETLRSLLDIKPLGCQSILELRLDEVDFLSNDSQESMIQALQNLIIICLNKHADDDNLRFTFYKCFMYKPLVKIFVERASSSKRDHTAITKILKLVYISLQANADCQESEREFLEKELKQRLRSKFKDNLKILMQTNDGNKCNDIQLLSKNIYETYFKKNKGCCNDIKKFFKECEEWIAKNVLRLHTCHQRGLAAILLPIPAAALHIFDIYTDLKIGLDSLKSFSQRLGSFMIALVITTLFHENYQSAIELYKAEEELLRVELGRFELTEKDWKDSSLHHSNNKCKMFCCYFWPFKMKEGEKAKAVVFNIFTVSMMRPVVDRLVVLTHSPTNVRTVIRQESKRKSLNQFFMITEQIPQLLIQFYLFQIYFNNFAISSEDHKNMANQPECKNTLQNFTYDYEFFEDQQNLFGLNTNAPYWLIVSMIIPFLKIPASTVSLEKAFRKLDPLTPKMSEEASCLLYLTYIMMIPSRLFLHTGLMHTTPNHFYNVLYILFLTILWFGVNCAVISNNCSKCCQVRNCCQVRKCSQVRKWWMLILFSFRDFWVISLRDVTAYMGTPSEVSYKSLRNYKRIMVISSFYFVEGVAGAIYIEHCFPCGREWNVFRYQGWLWLLLYIVSATSLILLCYSLQPQKYHLIPERFPRKSLMIFGFGLVLLVLASIIKFVGNLWFQIALSSILAFFTIVCVIVYLGLIYGEAKDKKRTIPCCSGEETDRELDSESDSENLDIENGEESQVGDDIELAMLGHSNSEPQVAETRDPENEPLLERNTTGQDTSV